MGDTCTVYISFGGKITRAAAMELVGVLDEQYYNSNDDGAKPTIDNLGHTFCAYEVNFANIDEIDAVCREHGINYDMHHDAGGGYAAGCVRLLNGEHHETTGGDGPMILLSRVLEVETLVSGMADLIKLARFMCGDFPKLEIEG